MKRYQLIEDFGGMKKGDVIETAEISNMLAPIAIELQEPELVVGTEGEKDGENCSEQDQQDQQDQQEKDAADDDGESSEDEQEQEQEQEQDSESQDKPKRKYTKRNQGE